MKATSAGAMMFTLLATGCVAEPTDELGVGEQALAGTSSEAPYLVPLRAGVSFEALISVGDESKHGYRMVGIPDGLGAYAQGGKLHVLMNHELNPTQGIARAHGARGAFISHWKIDKDFEVEKGEDLIKQVALWDVAGGGYAAPTTGVTLARFCSGDLPARSALYDESSDLGYPDRIYMAGEEADDDGRAFAHEVESGISYELPRMGRMGFENLAARPDSGATTVVVGTDDGDPAGEVVVYVGTKTSSGSPPERAGLTNGTLYGIRIPGYPREQTAGVQRPPPAAGTPIELFAFGDVTGLGENALQAIETANGVTSFDRPEDVHWNPANPDQLLFTTTASFTRSTRLWRVTFDDGRNPALGGTIECLVDGNTTSVAGVTPRMFDNLTVTNDGRWVYLQEDPGNQAHLAKIWRFDLQTRTLQLIAQHDPARFILGVSGFLTQDEESSGILDAADILGAGKLILDVQVHRANPDPELVQYGQLLVMTVAD